MPTLRAVFTPSGFDSVLPDQQLAWPNVGDMLGATHARRTNLGRQLKLSWGLLRTVPYRQRFVNLLQDLPHWKPVFAGEARSFEPLVQNFLDRRLRTRQRFECLGHDLLAATAAFGVDTCERLAQGQAVQVWGLAEGLSVRLSINSVCRREGYWALGLYTPADLRLCQLTFSLGQAGCVLVGSVQGAAAQDEQAQQGVRELTRLAEGLRPPYLLLEVLRVLCRAWGLTLQGVDPRHHVKRRWHQRELKVAFDYRAFWTDAGGHVLADGRWSVPVQREARDLQDVPSKRRAMYRRRQAMLDAMPGQIEAVSVRPVYREQDDTGPVNGQRRPLAAAGARRPPGLIAAWEAYLVGAVVAIASLVAVVWVNDLFTPQGERTIYTANCVGGDWADGACTGELVAGPRLRFRALKAHRQVMYWTVAGSEPVQVLWNCNVVDAANWTCPTPADVNSKLVLEMRDGQAYYRWLELERVPDMAKLRWLLSGK